MDKRCEKIATGMTKMKPGQRMEIIEIVSDELRLWGAGNDYTGQIYACPVNTTNLCHSFYGSRWDLAKTEYGKSSPLVLAHTVLTGRTHFYYKYTKQAQP
jgi:hypothetical protein